VKAKERIDTLVDPASFLELGAHAESQSKDFGMDKKASPGDGVITGRGKINGRKVLVYAQDADVLKGSVGLTHAMKIRSLLDLAVDLKTPVIGLNESVGGRIQEGIDTIRGYSRIFYGNIRCSGLVPQISAIFSSCAGGAVYSPALTDFIFMIENESHMFITGPIAIESVTGEKTTKEELGGAKVHGSVSAVADFVCKNEIECLNKIRELFLFLPSNCEEKPLTRESAYSGGTEDSSLDSIVPENPRKAYDMRQIITKIVDGGDFFEAKSLFARNMIVGFARLNGRSVGFVANQPLHLAGAIDINASIKAARFIRFCDCFNIPIITLVDTPAYLPGVKQEHDGIIRHGAKMLFAYGESTVPKITLIIRKGFGGGNPAMCNKEMGADFVFAWPSAEIAVLGAEAAAEVLYRNEIAEAVDPDKIREQKIQEYRQYFSNPFLAAKKHYVDEIIEPKDTRKILTSLLESLEDKDGRTGGKKHGNIPL
jgi:acetyl-CoA carboxylase carboxyltransferase component